MTNIELMVARRLVKRLLTAMEMWGSWEDGVPDMRCYGANHLDEGSAYDDAKRAVAEWEGQVPDE